MLLNFNLASTLDILEEEDDTEFATPSAYPKSLLPESVAKIDKKKKETSTSSSSSSSSSSFKSAVSSFQQPKKVMPAIVTAKKLDIIKKREEDAQRNRAENLKKKQEFQKKWGSVTCQFNESYKSIWFAIYVHFVDYFQEKRGMETENGQD